MTSELEDYKNRLSAVDASDLEAWRKILVEGMELLDLSDEACARLFDVSRPAVVRWREGLNSPVPYMRSFVVTCLLKHIFERADG